MFPFIFVAAASGQVFEWAFIFFGLALAIFAMINGYAYHKKPVPFMLAMIGFTIFIIAHLTIEHDLNHGIFIGLAPFIIGGTCIFAAHYLNHKFIHSHKCACDHIGEKV
jgi:hypothetical protein